MTHYLGKFSGAGRRPGSRTVLLITLGKQEQGTRVDAVVQRATATKKIVLAVRAVAAGAVGEGGAATGAA